MKTAVTRIDTIMAEVTAKISTRAYLPGMRLPSVRSLAQSGGFSPSTVAEAYERLVAAGVIYARPGAGFYVAEGTVPLALAETHRQLDREVDPLWVSRQSLALSPQVLKPGCGWLPADWLYQTGVRRSLRAVARAEAAVLGDYATPLGLPALRQWLARRLATMGIAADMEQIILTESGTQAIDLICRFLLSPGDMVLVDDPCYFNFHALLRAHQVHVLDVPYTPQGPDTVVLAQLLATHRPKLYITNAAVHNPTGATLAPATAYKVLQLAEAANLLIVEDDIFADFEATPVPRLAALDGLSRVLSIGSFSKTLSASLRCGYIAVRGDWVDALVDLKIATGLGGGQLAAAVVHTALTDSGYRKHMQAVHARLAVARAEAVARLADLGIVPWVLPRAGMFLWCRLPAGISAVALARYCLAQDVMLAPGNVFSQSHRADGFMRFNVAQMHDERIFDVLAAGLHSKAA